MKTTENIKLTTVGELFGELKKYKKNHWDDCVVAWLKDDERTFGVVGMGNDKDGDLRIIVEEVDDDDVVGCHVTVFGEYEEMPRKAPAPGKAKGNRGEIIASIAIMAGSALLVFYKAYTLITGTGGPVWESVLYIVGASIAAAVVGLSLYYSKEDGR